MFVADPEPTNDSTWYVEEWYPDTVENLESAVVEYRKRGWKCVVIDYDKMVLRVIIEWDKRPEYVDKMQELEKVEV